MRASASATVLFVLCTAGFGQTNADKPVFEAADVQASPRTDWVKDARHPMQGGFLTADRYELRRATMLDLIHIAFDVDAEKVSGGPSWLDYDRFDITAKAARETPPAVLRRMLQTLLAERFGLLVKPDTELSPAYLLTRGKRELNLRKPADASIPASR